jgi:hypothetical protein
MALRLVKNLRKPTVLAVMTRGRAAPSEEIVEPPHDYYIVKDYDRNPFYMSMIYASKPGFKKDYDQFKKYSERREANWEPRYKGQQIDMSLGWLQIAFFILLPLEYFVVMHMERKYRVHSKDPLHYNFGRPSEF